MGVGNFIDYGGVRYNGRGWDEARRWGVDDDPNTEAYDGGEEPLTDQDVVRGVGGVGIEGYVSTGDELFRIGT